MDIYLPLYTAVSAPPPVVQVLWSQPWPPCVWASGLTPLSWTLIYFQTPRSPCPRSVHAYWCSPGIDRQDWQNKCNKQMYMYFDIYRGNIIIVEWINFKVVMSTVKVVKRLYCKCIISYLVCTIFERKWFFSKLAWIWINIFLNVPIFYKYIHDI